MSIISDLPSKDWPEFYERVRALAPELSASLRRAEAMQPEVDAAQRAAVEAGEKARALDAELAAKVYPAVDRSPLPGVLPYRGRHSRRRPAAVRLLFGAAPVLLVVLGLAGLLVAGCSSPDAVSRTTPAVTPSPVAAPTSASPSPSAPAVLTREEAGRRYLALVAPTNTVRTEFQKQCARDLDTVNGLDTVDKSQSALLDSSIACARKLVGPLRTFATALRSTPWPVEAQQAVADLAAAAEAEAYVWDEIARASSAQGITDAYSKIPSDGRDRANLVRARLGIPAVP